MTHQSDFETPYVKVFKDITHWHEHEIHDRLSAILGFNTWEIGTPNMQPYIHMHEANYRMDLTIDFPTREDYERCVSTLVEVLSMEPD